MNTAESGNEKLQAKIYEIIFGYESRSGKFFDIVLICMIMVSVVAVMIDSHCDLSHPLWRSTDNP